MYDEDFIISHILERSNDFFRAYVNKMRWCSVPVRGNPKLMDCEWLSNAFSESGNNILFSSNQLNEDGDYILNYIESEKKSLEKYINLCRNKKYVIADCCKNGLMFHDNLCFVIAGNESFMSKAHPISLETSKKLFFFDFGTYKKNDHDCDTERYLLEFWDNYAINNCVMD